MELKNYWLLAAQAALIGLMVAVRQAGQEPSTALFTVVNIILIPAMARSLFRGKDNGNEN